MTALVEEKMLEENITKAQHDIEVAKQDRRTTTDLNMEVSRDMMIMDEKKQSLQARAVKFEQNADVSDSRITQEELCLSQLERAVLDLKEKEKKQIK
mmetsp:Transcript_6851/g.11061  ORF Transcript_6851/g.11061 Transcript_6851/m.11061 type:complete len:97 (-) Transcript_6851:776-1066(-)|eukprot:CAMPEP_0170510326 /NCGR_PEP_ID=MMETSP0208-20121228/65703_1 /TAXON_ID=197538 /ORGANISM="Strombidium inclinatum, Strain S3" /LENGTH=96 /DNA_ID=CAMNT_0010793777 /DNA_START=591 /DNA_END=881 /DNA_ORIENTATION=-